MPMIRVVLVERDSGVWRPFRQEQWMAEVRRDPAIAARPRLHFDVPEEGYRSTLEAWPDPDREAAIDRLTRAGATEVGPRPDRG